MNKQTIGITMAVLLLGVVLSGCAQGPGYSGTDTPLIPDAGDTSDMVVSDLTAGTGTGSDDVTTEDMDSLQSDLDELDVTTDELSESDI